MKHYEIRLPYFKKGDDLDQAIRHMHGSDDVSYPPPPELAEKALLCHAEWMESAAETLREMATLAASGQAKINQACTHYIGVDFETPELAEECEKKGLVWGMEYEEYEEDEFEDFDEEAQDE